MLKKGIGPVHVVVWLRGTADPTSNQEIRENGSFRALCGTEIKEFRMAVAGKGVCPECQKALESFTRLNGHNYLSRYVRALAPIYENPLVSKLEPHPQRA